MDLVGAEHQLEHRGIRDAEVEVGPAQRGEPVERVGVAAGIGAVQLLGEALEAVHRDRGQQARPVAEVVFRCGVGHPRAAGDSTQADPARPVFHQFGARFPQQGGRDVGGGTRIIAHGSSFSSLLDIVKQAWAYSG
jgi:hypothetical protein